MARVVITIDAADDWADIIMNLLGATKTIKKQLRSSDEWVYTPILSADGNVTLQGPLIGNGGNNYRGYFKVDIYRR